MLGVAVCLTHIIRFCSGQCSELDYIASMNSEDTSVLNALWKAVASGPSRASPLYRWMWANHDAFAQMLEKVRPDWTKLSEAFAERGFTTVNGTPLRPETVRQTWWRVRRQRRASIQSPPKTNKPALSESVPVSMPAPKAAPVSKPSSSGSFKLSRLAGTDGPPEPPVDRTKPINRG